MQEDKEQVFDAADNLMLALAAMDGMVRDMEANVPALEAAAASGFSTATDLADWLVRELDMPFRDAHHVTGTLVAMAEARGCDLPDLPLEDMTGVEPRITGAVYRRSGRAQLGRLAHILWRYRTRIRCARKSQDGRNGWDDQTRTYCALARYVLALALVAVVTACGVDGEPEQPTRRGVLPAYFPIDTLELIRYCRIANISPCCRYPVEPAPLRAYRLSARGRTERYDFLTTG
jgi:hypothetical protein